MNETALAVIERAKNQNAMIIFDQDNFQSTVPVYKTETSLLTFTKDDHHYLAKEKKYTPKKASVKQMGDAAGVDFLTSEACRTEIRDDIFGGKRTVWIASAQGRKRLPDGTWKTGNVEEYEFDPILRAMLDKDVLYLTETNKGTIAKTAMDYTKNARTRAITGACLRVIKGLTGMKDSFTEEEIKRPMLFSRIVRNTDELMKTPEGQRLITAEALGENIGLLFGKKPEPTQAIAASSETIPAESEPEVLRNANEPETEPEVTPSDTASLAEQANPAGNAETSGADDAEFQTLTTNLKKLMDDHKDLLNVWIQNHTLNPYDLANTELDSFVATVDSRKTMIERTVTFLRARGVAA